MSATGVKRAEPATDYRGINGILSPSVDDKPESEEMNAWCVFHKDGIFNLSIKYGRCKTICFLYVVAYQEFARARISGCSSSDGNCKNVLTVQFEVKTKRTLLADKDGRKYLYCTCHRNLVAIMINELWNVWKHQIFQTRKSGWWVYEHFIPRNTNWSKWPGWQK